MARNGPTGADGRRRGALLGRAVEEAEEAGAARGEGGVGAAACGEVPLAFHASRVDARSRRVGL